MTSHKHLDLREQDYRGRDYLALPPEQRARIVTRLMAEARVERSLALHRMIGRMLARLRGVASRVRGGAALTSSARG